MFIVWSRPPRLSTVNAHEPNAHGLHQRSLFDHLKTHKYTQPPSRNICFKSTFKCLCSMSNKHAHGHTWGILIDTPPDRQKERQRCTSAVRSFYSFINCSSSFLSDALIGLLIAVIAIEWHETESIVGNPSFSPLCTTVQRMCFIWLDLHLIWLKSRGCNSTLITIQKMFSFLFRNQTYTNLTSALIRIYLHLVRVSWPTRF